MAIGSAWASSSAIFMVSADGGAAAARAAAARVITLVVRERRYLDEALVETFESSGDASRAALEAIREWSRRDGAVVWYALPLAEGRRPD